MLWRLLLKPVLFRLPAEWVHYRAMDALVGVLRVPLLKDWFERSCRLDDQRLAVRAMGIDFPNCFGLAAGFDKGGRWYNDLGKLGFGHVEIGTITGQPQPGNPRPRLFRLPADQALLNRMGFNNPGAEAIATRLAHQPKRVILGINIGKSKCVDNSRAVADYSDSFRALFDFADYFCVNVSSPNTEGLRELQRPEPLSALLRELQSLNGDLAAARSQKRRPIVLKIAPDLSFSQLDEIAAIIDEVKLDGVTAVNTTTRRDGLKTPTWKTDRLGNGGISGGPLSARGREFVAWLRKRLNDSMTIIGSGGVMTADDAWRMIDAGADLVQLYTGFVYGGPRTVKEFGDHFAQKLKQFGCASLPRMANSPVKK